MTNSTNETASFDIDGLDDILRGGLPRGRLYLLKGTPGVGKTTLALQFLIGGAKLGERALYITLSETREELIQVARSHKWDLSKLNVFELNAADAQAFADEQYTMYQPSEIELKEVMRTLLAEVERVNPDRVVFDSLSEVRLLAHQPLLYRRQIFALKQYFAGKRCTVLLLDDCSGDRLDEHVESLVHGVVSLERYAPLYGGARRRLEISKLRGIDYRDGYHDFTIRPGGVQVFPRLPASKHHSSAGRGRLASGVTALDELLGEGLDRGTATLVTGPAGSGKSSLATQYAVAAADAGEPAAIFTFDESVSTLLMRSAGLGMALARHVETGLIAIHQVDPVEMSPGQFVHSVRYAVEHDSARVVVIDSLTGYLNAMPEERFLVSQLHELLAYMGQCGVVTILVATQHGLIGNMSTPVDVSYLADSVILLRYYEVAGEVRNAISVLKKRSGPHERILRQFALSFRGITIGEPLTAYHGVLTGVPTYTGNASTQARGHSHGESR